MARTQETLLDTYAKPRLEGLDIPERYAEATHWTDMAYCKGQATELFYPEKGGSSRAAKGICALCIVPSVCLEYALEADERFGVWGGLTARERRILERKKVRQKTQGQLDYEE